MRVAGGSNQGGVQGTLGVIGLLVLHLIFAGDLLSPGDLLAQEVMRAGRLTLELVDTGDGVRLTSLREDGVELLNTDAATEIFSLKIHCPSQVLDKTISCAAGWGDVELDTRGARLRIQLTRPVDPVLPPDLTATVTIHADEDRTDWELAVSGLGAGSLLDVDFPRLEIQATAAGAFLLPHYAGKLIRDPLAHPIDSDLLYPRGWSASMQFSAYYDGRRGLYFGFHDPTASLKHIVTRTKPGGIRVACQFPAPDRTRAGNDWMLPGSFRLQLFHGDWYDATQIYRQWVFAAADYRPRPDPRRRQRQRALGDIGLWIYYHSRVEETQSESLSYLTRCARYFGEFPLGIHWYEWNYKGFDNDYPRFFPELSWMSAVVQALQDSTRAQVMPYINGRLFDTDLVDYQEHGYPYATKNRDGRIYAQDFNHNHFAVMCPTQAPWQETLVDACEQLTGRIGAAGVYVDQVCASTPPQCMDASHGHPLGGGHWWRDGYVEMFQKMHASLPEDRFLTVEGGTDYLADQVDGFLVQGWTTDHLVPAFSAVYAGQVQLFGVATGTSHYHQQVYYCKSAQAFVFGIQPGRASSYIVFDPNAEVARPFVRRLGIMRYRLRRFLAYGRMLRPLHLGGDIPAITTTWKDYGTPVEVSVDAIQSSVWRSEDGREIAFVFVNASMTDVLQCTMTVDSGAYGLSGDLSLRQVTEGGVVGTQHVGPLSTQRLRLQPLEVTAYILASEQASVIADTDDDGDTALSVYPNPARDTLTVEVPGADTLMVYDVAGAVVARQPMKAGANRIDVSVWAAGVYLMEMRCGRMKVTVIH